MLYQEKSESCKCIIFYGSNTVLAEFRSNKKTKMDKKAYQIHNNIISLLRSTLQFIMDIHDKGIVLNREWNTLRLGNPIPGLYNQNGSERVIVRGHSEQIGDNYITIYEIIVLDKGNVVAKYKVEATESVEATDKMYKQ